MRWKVLVFIFILFTSFIFLNKDVYADQVNTECIGKGLASYMNAVVDGASGTNHIKLLTPVFNVTDTTNTPGIISAMVANGAKFSNVDAFAGNVYIYNSTKAYDWYTNTKANYVLGSFGQKQYFKDVVGTYNKNIVFTEYGDKDVALQFLQNHDGSIFKNSEGTYFTDYNNMQGDGSVLSMLYFNGLLTNPDPQFAGYDVRSILPDIISTNYDKSGINSAAPISGGSFTNDIVTYNSRNGTQIKWQLEIVTNPNDVNQAAASVNAAFDAGLTPVIRICAGGINCGFNSSSQILIDFIKKLSGQLTGDQSKYVYIIAGPNEPETETWATPDCAGTTTTPPNQYDLSQEIPCDQTTYDKVAVGAPEYHSLRPYPANPCYKKVDETALTCGNDLIVKKTFHGITSGSPPVGCSQTCSSSSDGTTTCNYICEGLQDKIKIDLTKAKLPIVGNTEDVPNATWSGPNTNATNLTAAERVNGYVSWYLNGVLNRAEEEFMSYPTQYVWDFSDSDANYLINYSGPLNKLLPFAIQQITRIASVDNAQTKQNEKAPDDKTARHDQIVACPISPNNLTMPCFLLTMLQLAEKGNLKPAVDYFTQRGVSFDDIKSEIAYVQTNVSRLSFFKYKKPPLETDFKTLTDWITNFSSWLGNTCLTSSISGCSFDLNSLVSQIFRFIPYSSTEDRAGQIFTDTNNSAGVLNKTVQLPEGGGNGATVTNVSFNPDSSSHNLYFSHMQEDAELAKILQSTYATRSNPNDPNPNDPNNNNWEKVLQEAIANQNLAHTFPTNGCVKQEVRTGSGDNLYGNIDRTTDTGNPDQQISGKLSYNASFSCQFKTTVDQQCVTNCLIQNPNDTTCTQKCSHTSTCDKDIYTSLGIYTKTPKSYELFQRLVDGSMSVFKRFFPKIGADSPEPVIKDVPASTNVSYQSDANGTQAGMTWQSGDNAQIYFDHVGSLQDYFLNDIQKALRPKEIGNQQPGPGAICTIGSPITHFPASGWLITTPTTPSNLVTSLPSEFGKTSCDWASGKSLAFEANANFFPNGVDSAVGPYGSNGLITNLPPQPGTDAMTVTVDNNGNANVVHLNGQVLPTITGINFAVTGVHYDNFHPPYDGPIPRTALGVQGNNLYLMVLRAATPDQTRQAMQQIGIDDQHFVMLDGDTSTQLCQGTIPIFGGHPVAVNFGFKSGQIQELHTGDAITFTPPLACTPGGGINPNPGQCVKLNYTLSYRNPNDAPKSVDTIEQLLHQSYGGDIFDNNQLLTPSTDGYATRYDEVVAKSKAAGYSPAFIIAIWLHESAGSTKWYENQGIPVIDFGCGTQGSLLPPNDHFEENLDCVLNLQKDWSQGGQYYNDVKACLTNGTSPNFEDWMLLFAEGCNGALQNNRQFCKHSTFPQTLLDFYNLVDNGSGF